MGYGDVSGTGHDALIIESAWGIGALGRQCWQGEQWFYCTPTLTSLAMSQWDTMAGSWKARQGDDLSGIGDFDGDGRVDLLFHHY